MARGFEAGMVSRPGVGCVPGMAAGTGEEGKGEEDKGEEGKGEEGKDTGAGKLPETPGISPGLAADGLPGGEIGAGGRSGIDGAGKGEATG